MGLAERETQVMTPTGSEILANDADLADGWFLFYTMNPADFRRLCKRIGGQDKLVGLDTTRCEGDVTSWSAKVPTRFYNRTTFGIGHRKPVKLTEAERAARVDRLRNLAKRRLAAPTQ